MNGLSPYAQLLAAFLVLAGLWRLLFQANFEARRQRLYAARLADRHARGHDAYFEELRALEAYPPPPVAPPMQRVIGALMAVLGAAYLAILLFGPEGGL